MMRRTVAWALLAGAVFAGCSAGPSPIVAGRHQCMHCKMSISDVRFAAQYVTEKGKRFTFDSIECLVNGMQAGGEPVAGAWVADYEMADTWVPVERAVFLYSGHVHSPMGAGLAAFGPPATPSEVHRAYGGTILTWPEVRVWVERSERGHIVGNDTDVGSGLTD